METIKDCFSMENRIIRHHGWFYHPRTMELIIGIEHDESKRPSFKSRHQSLVTPAVAHNRQQNRPCSVKLSKDFVIAVNPRGVAIVTPETVGTVTLGKPTSQYSTVWYSRNQSRK